ncbi:hypothetical protein DFP72DRAFT_583065 [Ephemerocybe angulata]|uniref:Uncharacterized protein n=1 Tax=Ephemerocybe angulata TaxID=980116 RepID=A0A8H6HKF4_9AGAR|nr:hypothetical protein DFP72DRAFT_583065 [Tulosesus angulatus]
MSGKAIPTGPRALLASTSSASSSTPASSQPINHSQRPPPTGPSSKRIPTGPRSLVNSRYVPPASSSKPSYGGHQNYSAPGSSGPSAPPNGVDNHTNGRFSSPTVNGKKPEPPTPSPASQVMPVHSKAATHVLISDRHGKQLRRRQKDGPKPMSTAKTQLYREVVVRLALRYPSPSRIQVQNPSPCRRFGLPSK